MNRLSDLLIQKLSQYDGQPLVINDWCHFITFDIMGELGFGQSYGQLESGRLHDAIGQITKYLRIGVCAIQVPWLVNIVQSIPGLEDPEKLFRKFSERCMDEREKVNAIDEQFQFPHGLRC
jgi:cytochrome P450 family 628